MHLLKINIKGFKSFVDEINIGFNQGVTGVIGPNGCGKSNIADAIKWVLGEKSPKNLRGKTMDDVIFAGSQNRKPSNYAEVTLVFDNSDRKVKLDFQQLALTRRLYRGQGTNEYYINQKQVRLKDLQDLIFDTGLGQNTLALISQGTVSSFAEATALERRKIFEEAANVSKYKKRKLASLRKLERSTENLNRLADIIFELEKQLKPLKRQAAKAAKFLAWDQQLKNQEIALLVFDITNLNQQKSLILKQINLWQNQIDNGQKDWAKQKAIVTSIKKKADDLETSLTSLHKQLLETGIQLQAGEANKIRFEEQSKYFLNQWDKKNQKTIRETLKTWEQKIIVKKQQLGDLEVSKNKITTALGKLKTQEKKCQATLDLNKYYLNKITVEQKVIQKQLENNSHLLRSTRALKAAKGNFPGLKGLFSDLITSSKQYHLAISSATGAYQQAWICDNVATGQKAIQFLKENKLGKGLFLPLDNLVSKFVNPHALIGAQQGSGFIDQASNLVTCDAAYLPALTFVLGHILVAKNLAAAQEISLLTAKKYRIVTLDGQSVNVGGSLTGGFYRAASGPDWAKGQIQKQNQEMANLQKTINESLIEQQDLKIRELELNQNWQNKQFAIEKLNEQIIVDQTQLQTHLAKYKAFFGTELTATKSKNNLNQEMIETEQLILTRNHLKQQISSKISLKNNLQKTIVKQEQELSQFHNQFRDLEKKCHQEEITLAKLNTTMDQNLERLNSNYQMTYDFAKNLNQDLQNVTQTRASVVALKAKIARLGAVNIEAIDQLKTIQPRYDDLQKQYQQLKKASHLIKDIIADMDQKTIVGFDQTFQKINDNLQITFEKLFGGGSALLAYSDPGDILESGIEIKVQPPGKKVKNLHLFSGGEKSLIALAVLFAIIETKPLPLCVFDEVEAPLDLANIERFGNYLHTFAQKTQFIVITHRPGTMAKCDILYGVTMQEKGVSKLVSVKLDDYRK